MPCSRTDQWKSVTYLLHFHRYQSSDFLQTPLLHSVFYTAMDLATAYKSCTPCFFYFYLLSYFSLSYTRMFVEHIHNVLAQIQNTKLWYFTSQQICFYSFLLYTKPLSIFKIDVFLYPKMYTYGFKYFLHLTFTYKIVNTSYMLTFCLILDYTEFLQTPTWSSVEHLG